MSRPFSLAPGGWVGNKPGRSGDTSEEEHDSDRNRGKDRKADGILYNFDLTKVDFKQGFQVVQRDSTRHPLRPGILPNQSYNNVAEMMALLDKTHKGHGKMESGSGKCEDNAGPSTTQPQTPHEPRVGNFKNIFGLDRLPHQGSTEYRSHQPRRPQEVFQALPPLGYQQNILHNDNKSSGFAWPTTPSSPYPPSSGGSTVHSLRTWRRGMSPNTSTPASSTAKTTSTARTTPQSGLTTYHDRLLLLGQLGRYNCSASPLTSRNQSPHLLSPLRSQPSTPGSQNGTSVLDELNKSPSPSQSILSDGPFHPSRALRNLPRYVDPELAYMAERVGIDLEGNYKGDITEEHIHNAMAPPYANCALHIIGFPADVTLREAFSVIEGKVFSFQLHNPVPGKWDGCGARLVFTTREAAEAFFFRAQSGCGISVRGHVIRVLWNRDPCRPQRSSHHLQSRVLQLRGPDDASFSADVMHQFFASKLLFELVEQKEWVVPGGKKVVELQFPSILGQSRPAMKQFYERLEKLEGPGDFMIQYGPDPCDPLTRGVTWWEGRRF